MGLSLPVLTGTLDPREFQGEPVKMLEVIIGDDAVRSWLAANCEHFAARGQLQLEAFVEAAALLGLQVKGSEIANRLQA